MHNREILRVFRRANETLTRCALYERSRIDDIRDLDAGLENLLRAGVIQQAGSGYRLTHKRIGAKSCLPAPKKPR